MASSSSFQSSESSSTSAPVSIRTPENDIIDAISGVASGLAQQMVQWANGVFAQTSKITDDAVGNFFRVSQQMQGLSDNLTNQYNDVFAPQNRSLAAEANSYNSAARQAVDMGAAGATQAQAGDQALKNAEEQLRSYGIDPSDGRYAALDKAAAVQNAANVAGAENLQRERTAQVGRDLRTQAVQVGSMLPAAIANVNNTAIQANTGASNASLANANTGRNLQSLPNDYLKTAMEVKLPPTGQNSQSQGKGSGSGQSSSPDGQQGGGRQPSGGQPSGGGGGSRGGEGPAWMPQHGTAQASSFGGGGGPRYGQPGSRVIGVEPYKSAPDGAWGQMDWSDPLAGVDANDFQNSNYYQPEEGYGIGVGQQASDPFQYADNPFSDYGDYGQNDTYGGGGDYDTYGNMGGGTDTPWGNISYDTAANEVDPGWGETYDTPAATDWGSGADQYSDSYGTQYSGSDYYAGDYSGNYDDYGGVYAKGGPVPPRGQHPMPGGRMMQGAQHPGGGRVPPQMSPSGGRQVDDIPAQSPQGPARLNANEFVIPQDVAMWKGQEFFQKLIDQSRQRRVTAPAPGGQQQPMR